MGLATLTPLLAFFVVKSIPTTGTHSNYVNSNPQPLCHCPATPTTSVLDSKLSNLDRHHIEKNMEAYPVQVSVIEIEGCSCLPSGHY